MGHMQCWLMQKVIYLLGSSPACVFHVCSAATCLGLTIPVGCMACLSAGLWAAPQQGSTASSHGSECSFRSLLAQHQSLVPPLSLSSHAVMRSVGCDTATVAALRQAGAQWSQQVVPLNAARRSTCYQAGADGCLAF
jgi:hypothetical protein